MLPDNESGMDQAALAHSHHRKIVQGSSGSRVDCTQPAMYILKPLFTLITYFRTTETVFSSLYIVLHRVITLLGCWTKV